MNRELRSSIKSFLIELGLYALLVVVYFFLVLRFLGSWLQHLFQHERRLYAAVALLLIVGQGLFLEVLTRALLAFIKPRTEE
jgi:hypothetical protein